VTAPVLPSGSTVLFDVVITTASAPDGSPLFQVKIVDRYHDGPDVPTLVGCSPLLPSLSEAIEWSRAAVTAFMEGTDA